MGAGRAPFGIRGAQLENHFIYIHIWDRCVTVVNARATNRQVAGSVPAGVTGHFH